MALIHQIVNACIEARETRNLRPVDVARMGRLDKGTVARWEALATGPEDQSWPQYPEKRVQAYATASGIPASDLWRRAVDLHTPPAETELTAQLEDLRRRIQTLERALTSLADFGDAENA